LYKSEIDQGGVSKNSWNVANLLGVEDFESEVLLLLVFWVSTGLGLLIPGKLGWAS
jgi:hypothetical protein